VVAGYGVLYVTRGLITVTPDKPSLFIVDALNFLFRAFHALPPLTTTKGVPTNALHGFSQMLLRMEREQRPTHLCVVFDAPGENFRYELYPAYKAHRTPMPPELASQIAMVHTVIEAFGLTELQVPGYEADDIIATLAKVAVAAGMEVVICSSDKDLQQLCSAEVNILDTMRNRRLGPPEVQEKFGVPPELVGDVLALMGDSIDNVPGVDGIGPKTAAELINKFGSLEELLARAGEVKGKRGEALVAARDTVRLSRELVRLRDDAALPKTLEQLHRVEPDRERLLALFRELEFTRLVDQLSPTGISAMVPQAVRAPEPIPEAVAPSRPPPPATVLLDRAALEAAVRAVEAAGAVGVAALTDGPTAVRADLVGLAFALPEGPRFYLPLTHRYLGAPACLRESEALGVLEPLLASPAVGKHAHDAKTLEVLLRRRGLPLRGVASDAMIASYLLDASRTRYDLDVIAAGLGVGEAAPRSSWLGTGRNARTGSEVPVEEAGARLGAEAAAALSLARPQGDRLVAARLDGLYRDMELPLAHVLAKIECRGIELDVPTMRAIGQEVSVSMVALETEIHALAGQPFNINSPKQLADVLFGKLSLPVVRRTKTGPSTDADTLEELASLHPVPAKIVEYRVLSKLKGTYIDALPGLVNPATGRLHTSFNQAVAATGRLSSSDPNLQNIPIRTEVGRRIRQAFVAKPGHLLVSADYSQIELRILAHFSEDPAFVAAFRSGEDIHLRTAAEVFGVPTASVTPEHRRVAKAINFGLVFGQSDFGLGQVLRIPRAQARAYIDSYFQRYAGVRAYMERSISEARDTGESSTLLGRRRPLPEIRASRAQDRAAAERMARNTPIQGSAADLLKLAMIRVDAGIDAGAPPAVGAALLLTVHDELVFEVPEERAPTFKEWVKKEMESVYALKVPLVVDVGSGRTWGDAH
jgi:DNA polymerase-1